MSKLTAILTGILAIVVLAVPCQINAAGDRPDGKKGMYFVEGLTGTAGDDLDELDITGADSPNEYNLADGDSAILTTISGTTATFSVYVFDDNGTDEESSPSVIRPNDYDDGGVWRLSEASTKGITVDKTSGVAGLYALYEANSTDTDYVGWMGPASISESFSHQFSNTQPAGSFYLWGTPAGTGDPNSQKVSAATIVTPGTGIATWLATPSSVNLVAALTDETGTGSAVFANSPTLVTPTLGTPASGNLANCTFPTLNQNTTGTAANVTETVAIANGGTGQTSAADAFSALKQAATDAATGVVELATTAETTTGNSSTLVVTPDGLSGSVYGQKEIGWAVVDSDTEVAIADGLQAAVIPASMNGMNLIDLTCSIYDQNSASGDATTVVLRRVRAGTPQDMTSTGVTISHNEYTASDETVNTSYDDVATGDQIFVDINAITSGAAQLGLSCTAVFQTP